MAIANPHRGSQAAPYGRNPKNNKPWTFKEFQYLTEASRGAADAARKRSQEKGRKLRAARPQPAGRSAPPQSGNLSVEQVITNVARHYGYDPAYWIELARRESSLNPNERHHDPGEGEGYDNYAHGLYQLGSDYHLEPFNNWARNKGWEPNWRDPLQQTAYVIEYYNNNGSMDQWHASPGAVAAVGNPRRFDKGGKFMTAGEPIVGIGLRSGKARFTLGENTPHEEEVMTIKPVKGVKKFATGGAVTSSPSFANMDEYNAYRQRTQAARLAPPPTAPNPDFNNLRPPGGGIPGPQMPLPPLTQLPMPSPFPGKPWVAPTHGRDFLPPRIGPAPPVNAGPGVGAPSPMPSPFPGKPSPTDSPYDTPLTYGPVRPPGGGIPGPQMPNMPLRQPPQSRIRTDMYPPGTPLPSDTPGNMPRGSWIQRPPQPYPGRENPWAQAFQSGQQYNATSEDDFRGYQNFVQRMLAERRNPAPPQNPWQRPPMRDDITGRLGQRSIDMPRGSWLPQPQPYHPPLSRRPMTGWMDAFNKGGMYNATSEDDFRGYQNYIRQMKQRQQQQQNARMRADLGIGTEKVWPGWEAPDYVTANATSDAQNFIRQMRQDDIGASGPPRKPTPLEARAQVLKSMAQGGTPGFATGGQVSTAPRIDTQKLLRNISMGLGPKQDANMLPTTRGNLDSILSAFGKPPEDFWQQQRAMYPTAVNPASMWRSSY